MDFDGSVLHAKVEQPATIVLIVLRIPGCTRDSATGTIILLTCKHHVYTSILRCFIQLLPPYIAIAVCVSIASGSPRPESGIYTNARTCFVSGCTGYHEFPESHKYAPLIKENVPSLILARFRLRSTRVATRRVIIHPIQPNYAT